jgi:acetyl-CoA carboxylase biotin carboxylase subunit
MIIWGTDRKHAILRARRAFEEFKVEGIKTTIPFHQKVLQNEKFIEGDFDTSFIDKQINN